MCPKCRHRLLTDSGVSREKWEQMTEAEKTEKTNLWFDIEQKNDPQMIICEAPTTIQDEPETTEGVIPEAIVQALLILGLPENSTYEEAHSRYYQIIRTTKYEDSSSIMLSYDKAWNSVHDYFKASSEDSFI